MLNQTFHPDVVSTAQHLSDLAVRLVERGHEVIVIAGRRAYDDPQKTFPRQEMWRGVHIRRIGSTRFGKQARWRRAVDFASFMIACCFRLVWLPRPEVVVALTSPPLISFIGAGYARLKAARFYYWVMDFNPDEAIAAGWLRQDSLVARVLEKLSRFSLHRAERIVALDRFMKARIEAKDIAPEKIAVLPPWSLDTDVRFDAAGRQTFRMTHGLADKFVIMYSGNHSPCHPLDTLMEAAKSLAVDDRFAFLFVGGGSEFLRVKQFAQENRLANVICLPYQPLTDLSASLSAADLHVVVMGDAFVGLVHPCKIYNILLVGAPVLYIGPRPSHVSEILDTLDARAVASIAHQDVKGCVREIQRLAAEKAHNDPARPATVNSNFSRDTVLRRFVELLEQGRE